MKHRNYTKKTALKNWVLFWTNENTWTQYELHLGRKLNKNHKEENKPIKKNDSMHVQQIKEMFSQILFEAIFRAGWFKIARKIIPVFDHVGMEGTLVFRAIDLGHV